MSPQACMTHASELNVLCSLKRQHVGSNADASRSIATSSTGMEEGRSADVLFVDVCGTIKSQCH